MLPFFTDPYPDELIYSAIARYHFYSGNIECKDTLEEVFQSRSVIPSVEIGSHFYALAGQMGNHYSVENLLSTHTIYPFYAPFLSKKQQQEIFHDVQGDGKGLYTRLGMVAGGICRKDGLYYCSQCAWADMDTYGEPYIHREHQLQGIDFCAHHDLQLKKYPDVLTEKSRIKFIRFEAKRMDFSTLQEVKSSDHFDDIQVKLATMAYQLLNTDIDSFSREDIFKKYRLLLREKNLMTTSNQVRQKELFEAFQAKFSKGFLEKYESRLNEENEYNWLKVLTRNEKRHVHSLRHLFFLYFLDKDVEELLHVGEDGGPFGKGPWPCLNKAADHFKQIVIHNVEITRDFKSTSPIGTFECSCGFIYARKGPDQSKEDQYRIGRVKAFGDTWKAKLQSLANNSCLSIRAMAEMLGVDSKTVKKYLSKDGQKEEAKSKVNPLLQQYRQQLLEGIQRYPHDSRTQIRERFQREYTYLYRHDKEWLFKQLPIIRTKVKSKAIVDWEARDREYCSKVKKLYEELMVLDKPIRITVSIVGKRLGILSNLEKHLDKLPQTKKFLNEVTETIQQFQIRRCSKIIDQMLQEQKPVRLWKVQRIGGVKSHHFHEIKPYLETHMQKKQEVGNDERTTG